ncbi:hypothetical protein CGCS363_v005268 [Colletotrichum siamense]|uniref:uncharacterized protein n=1 Tax=Colletotrichum siamense TaxID=690259 RepID=UPI001872D4BB|nr:uncharacterized protein CGCS363_v005268 [Colletotrichum siamense]KAF5506745.1 hypothetical protein CGCS363_v005268 [Colletotrichum siamense]
MGHKHGWKPLTVSAAVLFSFAFVSFILAVIIEVYAQQSKRYGGLALSPSIDAMPYYVKFSYLFLPTIVAVIYSLLWSWIDLDVKRIQPWLEMSRPEGAKATHSIFLDYPYEFVAFAPLRAFRRRHWATFYSGTVMILIFWLITPLQSAILGTGTINVREEVAVSSSQALVPSSDQIYSMDQSILNEGYAITWLRQPLPAFTTADYTLLPFHVDSDTTRAASTNWTGSTVKYWTEIECWPAEMFPGVPYWSFVDGRGCNATEVLPYGATPVADKPYKIQYYGYHASDYADYWLSIPCYKIAVHKFLATWAYYEEGPVSSQDIRGSFCEASYFKQEVNATVSAATNEPIEGSIVPTGPREELKPAEFNSSAFEYLLGAGVSPVEMTVTRDYAFNHLLEQDDQTKQYGLWGPSNPMTGFAVGSAVNSQNLTTLHDFKNETFLGHAFNTTHKLLFSLAFRRMLNASGETTTIGTVEYEQQGIIVSRLYSAIVEGFLFLVGTFSMLLWWHGKRAPSQLAIDPASMGSLISICQNSSVMLDKFTGKGCFPDEKLQESFEDMRFYLLCGCQTPSRQTVIKVVDARTDFVESQRISLPPPDPAFSMGHYSPFKPLALRREIGSVVTLAMVGAVVAIVYLKMEEQRIGGLIRPTTNFEVLQILENYIPTVFATLLEPFWVLVNRLLCILQPFKDLWSGQRPAKGSINARYTSVPPQFVLWRAARSGHLVLVAICMLALLSNLLAVGLGGLFNERSIVVDNACEFQQTLKPTFNNDTVWGYDAQFTFSGGPIRYETPMYVTMNNVSQGTPLPPWIGNDYYFQPFSMASKEQGGSKEFTAQTRGFGVRPSCSKLDTLKSTGSGPVVNHTYMRNGQPVSGCPTSFEFRDLNRTGKGHPTDPLGPSTAEVIAKFSGEFGNAPCDVPLILGWSRSPNIKLSNRTEMETWSVICEPIFTTSMFNVTVDTEGYILKAVQISESSSTLDDPLTTNNTDTISTYLNRIINYSSTDWHNDSFTYDWMNYLIKIQPDGPDVLDPLSTPNTTALIPPIERIYRQLYALMLGLNTQWFNNYTEPVTMPGKCRRTEVRIFMDRTAFAISLFVLGLNIIVAIALYGCNIKHFLPRVPTTIGSTLAYVAPSRVVREYEGPASLSDATFSFGRYVGDDGRAHVGIEMDPYVVPVKLSALRKGDTEPRTGLMRRVLGRRKGKRGDTWL